jgi:2-oxoglutarate ferredoxin oxidoreductase subunit beta
VYNDEVFQSFTAKDKADDAQIHVEHGKPLTFGVDQSKGLKLDPTTLKLAVIDAKARPSDVLVHDETNATLAQLLLSTQPPELPVALGVVYRKPRPSYEASFYANHPTALKRTGRVADALRQTSTWWVT